MFHNKIFNKRKTKEYIVGNVEVGKKRIISYIYLYLSIFISSKSGNMLLPETGFKYVFSFLTFFLQIIALQCSGLLKVRQVANPIM